MKRKIAVLTTSRADYGLLFWLMKGFKAEPSFTLQPVVTGSHLSRRFGLTIRELLDDGFTPAASVPLLAADDSRAAASAAVARGTAGFARAFSRLKPDLLVVLGDRIELLAAASAAVALRIPIAHLHGGESSDGSLDEQVRHAVTKLSHLHFAAAEPYRRRIIQMGEDPARVFNVGAPGLEHLRRMEFLDRAALEKRVGLSLSCPFALATVHPDTLGGEKPEASLEALLPALDREELPAVFTYANSDAGGRAINARIDAYVRARPGRAAAVASLGHQGYLSLARLSAVVAGNSSSGIIEVPSLRRPTVNIGARQAGRLRAPSVIDCPPETGAAARALRLALSRRFLRSRCAGKNPYGAGDVSARVIAVLKRTRLGASLLRKSFHDQP